MKKTTRLMRLTLAMLLCVTMAIGLVCFAASAEAAVYTVTANSCTADPEGATAGTTVTVTADEAPKGYWFSGWSVEPLGIALSNPAGSVTTFVMGVAEFLGFTF